MKINQIFFRYTAPIILLFLFFLDGQLSTLLTNALHHQLFISSYVVLLFGIVYLKNLSMGYGIVLYAIMGLLYDVYFFGVLGIAVILFPLMATLIYSFSHRVQFRLWTILLMVWVIIFFVEFLGFLVARVSQLTNLSMFLFVSYDLMPSLVFNSIILFLLYPIFRCHIQIINKT